MNDKEPGPDNDPNRDSRQGELPTQEMLQEVLKHIRIFSVYNEHGKVLRDEQSGEVINVINHEVDSSHEANSLPHFVDDKDPQTSFIFFLATTDTDLQTGHIGYIEIIDWHNPDTAHITHYALNEGEDGLEIEKHTNLQRIFHRENEHTDGGSSFVTEDQMQAARETEKQEGLLSSNRKEVEDLLEVLTTAHLRLAG